MTVAFVYLTKHQIDYSSVHAPLYREQFSNEKETLERVEFLQTNGYEFVTRLPDYMVLFFQIEKEKLV